MFGHKSLIVPIIPIMAQDAALLFSFPWEPGIQRIGQDWCSMKPPLAMEKELQGGKYVNLINKQAGAELYQAQFKLGLAKHGLSS